jgi:hypothetical protein
VNVVVTYAIFLKRGFLLPKIDTAVYINNALKKMEVNASKTLKIDNGAKMYSNILKWI